MKKELRPVHDDVSCDVCARTILKGEGTEPFLAPGGKRYLVCELCYARAEHHGWIPEAAAGDQPTRVPRQEPRRPLLLRLRRRESKPENGAPPSEAPAAGPQDADPTDAATRAEPSDQPAEGALPSQPRSRPKDPRHVRAVPTTAEVKVERAVELFNGSDHQRTIAGVAKTLGAPWVTVRPDGERPSAVTVVVAWELSWYRYRVDLADEADPVVLLEKGEELGEIDESLRDWNGNVDAEGWVVASHGVTEGGS